MMPLWQQIIYFHLQPAILDGMLALGGVLLLIRIFRIRDTWTRSLLLFIPLVRPLLILLEGGAQTNRVSFPNVYMALRFPDPFNLIPLHEIVGENGFSSISALIGAFMLAALIAALAFLAFRWSGFIIFYRNIRRQASGLPSNGRAEEQITGLVLELSSKMGLRHPPAIILTESRWMTPCAIGFSHPALVIDPAITDDLSAEELHAVLAHELSHIRRRDGLWHWVSVLLRDIQAFSPFSHMSIARLSLEREKACDREAVEILRLAPRLMAQCLVKTSKLMMKKQSHPLPGYGLAFVKERQSVLEQRIRYLLDMEDENGSSRPIKRSSAGMLRKIATLIAWVPLVSVQLCLFAWMGDYILVIK